LIASFGQIPLIIIKGNEKNVKIFHAHPTNPIIIDPTSESSPNFL
jgi:hypothetical protein